MLNPVELAALKKSVEVRAMMGLPALDDAKVALWLIEEQRMSLSWSLLHDWVMADPLDRSLQYPAHLSDGTWESAAHIQSEEIAVVTSDTPMRSLYALCVALKLVEA